MVGGHHPVCREAVEADARGAVFEDLALERQRTRVAASRPRGSPLPVGVAGVEVDPHKRRGLFGRLGYTVHGVEGTSESPHSRGASKCLYLVVRSLDLTGSGQERRINRWKPTLNAFAITFEGRLF